MHKVIVTKIEENKKVKRKNILKRVSGIQSL